MSEIVLSGIGLVLAFALFAFLIFKGIHQAFVTILCAAFLALFSADGFVSAFFTSFTGGIGTFVTAMAMVFISGAMFGGVMNATGCGQSVAQQLIKWLGAKNAPYIILATTIICQLSGNTAYFIVVSIVAMPLLKSANLPRYIGMCAMLCGCMLGAFTLPGVPSSASVITSTYLGTSLYSAPLMSLVASVLGLSIGLFYITKLTQNARKNNIGYDPTDELLFKEVPRDGNLPSFWIAVLPIFIIIGGVFVLTQVAHLKAAAAVIICQSAGTLIMTLLNWNRFATKTRIDAVTNGMVGILPMIISMGTITGFAAVAQTTPFYTWATSKILELNVNPYVTTMLVVAVICGLCADSLGGLTMFGMSLAPVLLGMTGVNAEAVHRLAINTSQTIDSLPWSSHAVMQLKVWGYSHREQYKRIAICTILFTSIMAVFILICCLIFY